MSDGKVVSAQIPADLYDSLERAPGTKSEIIREGIRKELIERVGGIDDLQYRQTKRRHDAIMNEIGELREEADELSKELAEYEAAMNAKHDSLDAAVAELADYNPDKLDVDNPAVERIAKRYAVPLDDVVSEARDRYA